MPYTRRRTWPHVRAREDFTIHCKGTAVGRIHKRQLPEGSVYIWSIFLNGHVRKVEGVPIGGATESIEEAGSALKQSYEAMRAEAGVYKSLL